MRIVLLVVFLALLGGCDASDKPKPAGESGGPPPQDSGADKEAGKGSRIPAQKK